MGGVLVDERENLLIIYSGDGQGVKTITKDAYNELKFKEYEGNRIFYDFDDENKVAETFDSRIFNCIYRGKTMQLRDGNKIAEAIVEHKSTGEMKLYEATFKKEFYEANKKEIIEGLIGQFGGRVVITKEGYVVDNLFMVDNQGASHFYTTLGWKFLCTVAQGNLRKMIVASEVGDLELDQAVLTIIAKIYFLLNPKLSDHVFFDQLPPNIQKVLREQAKADRLR